MELGLVGMGRMGGGIAERLLKAGHQVTAYDADPSTRRLAPGLAWVSSLQEMVDRLAPPRAVWLMVPVGEPVERTLEALGPRLSPSDVVVDGGNSFYKDSLRRASSLQQRQVLFLDVGVSGGVWGAANGFCLMVGGTEAGVRRLRPVFEALAPAPDRGWAHVGPSGAGHFVKMVHNGIEYGLMQAYAEGFALLRRKGEFGLDLRQVGELWSHGSVVRSWLLDLLADSLAQDPDLRTVAPYVEDSGEGRWTVAEAVELNVPAPVITVALLQRLRSRDVESYSDRLLAMLRSKFGGHALRHDEGPHDR